MEKMVKVYTEEWKQSLTLRGGSNYVQRFVLERTFLDILWLKYKSYNGEKILKVSWKDFSSNHFNNELEVNFEMFNVDLEKKE